jgi:SAM-dependent methyltransferase
MTSNLVKKYDRLAEGFSEASYANLEFYMARRSLIATSWGPTLRSGDSLVELGCGDGYLARLLVAQGLRYRGVDISPKMVATAQRRLFDAGLKADFVVSDITRMHLSEPCDAVVSYMRAFFTYIPDPLQVLKQLRQYIQKKIIVDLEPRRTIPIKDAVKILKRAGFENVSWRPFFIPEEKKLPQPILKTFSACETIPVLRSVPLRWKFHVILKGEVR